MSINHDRGTSRTHQINPTSSEVHLHIITVMLQVLLLLLLLRVEKLDCLYFDLPLMAVLASTPPPSQTCRCGRFVTYIARVLIPSPPALTTRHSL